MPRVTILPTLNTSPGDLLCPVYTCTQEQVVSISYPLILSLCPSWEAVFLVCALRVGGKTVLRKGYETRWAGFGKQSHQQPIQVLCANQNVPLPPGSYTQAQVCFDEQGKAGFQLPFIILYRCSCAVNDLDNCPWQPSFQDSWWLLMPPPLVGCYGLRAQTQEHPDILAPWGEQGAHL